MNTSTHDSSDIELAHKQCITQARGLTDLNGCPIDFIPLDQETRTHVSTRVMCHHLGRKQQTARGWASAETFPDGLKPLRVNGRLAWPVAGIKLILGA